MTSPTDSVGFYKSSPSERHMTYTLSFRYRFEAAHRFTQSCEDSCATPHGHTWFAEARFATDQDGLGADDMVMEFSKLKRDFKRFITETVDHSFMHHQHDPILPALIEYIPKFRGLPFPGDPTTELIAALFFQKIETILIDLKSQEPDKTWPVLHELLIQETPTNGVSYRRPAHSTLLTKINSEFSGWWQVTDPRARHLKPRA